MMVASRSSRCWMVRVAMIAGTAHAHPETSGMKLRPCSPSGRMYRSMTNAARVMYPESSSSPMNRKRLASKGVCLAMPPNEPRWVLCCRE